MKRKYTCTNRRCILYTTTIWLADVGAYPQLLQISLCTWFLSSIILSKRNMKCYVVGVTECLQNHNRENTCQACLGSVWTGGWSTVRRLLVWRHVQSFGKESWTSSFVKLCSSDVAYSCLTFMYRKGKMYFVNFPNPQGCSGLMWMVNMIYVRKNYNLANPMEATPLD